MLISLILRFSSPRSRATLSTNDLAGFSVWKTWRPLARAAVKSSITGLMLNVAAHSTHEQQPVVRGQTQSPSSACPPLNKACNLAICATQWPIVRGACGWHTGRFYYGSVSILFKGCRKKRAVGKQWCIVGILVHLSQWDGFITQWEDDESSGM